MNLKGTEFQIKVWKEISKTYGKTRTYKQIAEAIGHPKSYRAVANACGKNPYPETIPCHRVVNLMELSVDIVLLVALTKKPIVKDGDLIISLTSSVCPKI